MTLQQLKYMVTTAEAGSTTEAARELFISQPSLSGAVKEAEKEAGISIFTRCRAGIALTKEGMEFLGYARQVVQQVRLLESRYTFNQPARQRFCISAQHYTFITNAFIELIQRFGQERFESILNETQTHQITMDVKNRFSDIGVLYLSDGNKSVLQKSLEENDLVSYKLFVASPYMFLCKDHPPVNQNSLKPKGLQPYLKFSFMQGNYESDYFAEGLFSNESAEKSIKASDRVAIVNFMIGLDGYTISNGVFSKYLQGDDIISIPLGESEMIRIGYIPSKDAGLTEPEEIYIDTLKEYKPQQERNGILHMEIKKLDYDFSVCKVADYSKVNLESNFCFIGKTDEENLLICLTEAVPDNTIERDDGQKAFRTQGVLGFPLIGMLSKISALLVESKIGIFTVSTYNIDYILTKRENFEKAIQASENAGYIIV